jgi:hypothetical protein
VSAPAIWQSVQSGWSASVEAGRRLVPRTSTHWGIVSVAGAFVMLALGAITSIVKTRQTRPAIGAADAGTTLLPGGGKDQLML